MALGLIGVSRASLDCGPRQEICRERQEAELRFARAGVAELVDAPGLGPGGRKPLEVQVLSPALVRLRASMRSAARSSASAVNSIGVAFGTSWTGASSSFEPAAAFSA